MGNRHSAAPVTKPRKNVHWRTAGRPPAPGRPEVLPVDGEEGSVRLQWCAPAHDGGAALLGYRVQCRREGDAAWLPTTPAQVALPELILSGLEPPHRYCFRVAAVNAVGSSDPGPPSDTLSLSASPAARRPPSFSVRLQDVTALENDKTEFRVTFDGSPRPAVAWFKDGYEIFSSRRTAITTDDATSVLAFHQTLASDEGEIRCTATNRLGHAVTSARLSLEVAPKLRFPRQYEDGLLYEVDETVYLKTSVVGKPTPTVEWLHDGKPLHEDERVHVATSAEFSLLKIRNARRADRGEYQVVARNEIGSDRAAFLVTVTAPPSPPRRVAVVRQLDRSVSLSWEAPADDGGCRVGNYVVEYYRGGWDVWLKAATSRRTSVTLFELIEGSEYRFRVKAESPYGMSEPSEKSAAVRIPGRAVDLDFLAAESAIISATISREEDDTPRRRSSRDETVRSQDTEIEVSRVRGNAVEPLRRRDNDHEVLHKLGNVDESLRRRDTGDEVVRRRGTEDGTSRRRGSADRTTAEEKAEKRKSFQLELEDVLSPPHLSLSAPELGSALPFRALRNSVSSSELLHEHAMARFYQAVAMEQEHRRRHIPSPPAAPDPTLDGVDPRWNHSFEEDYTASTVSTDGSEYDPRPAPEDITYSPRGKPLRPEPAPPPDTIRPIALPDPNFVPKPILKRREADIPEIAPVVVPPVEEKTIKKPKTSIFKKLTEMPARKPVSFPKLLQKKEEDQIPEEETPNEEVTPREDETAIEHYGSLVREFGTNKKPPATLYLNTDDLKQVAERQRQPTKKLIRRKPTENDVNNKRIDKSKIGNFIPKQKQKKRPPGEKKNTRPVESSAVRTREKSVECEVVLSTERATVVIPIAYGELQARATVAVRSAIDRAVDVCLLLLAFWLFLFHDERLAVPPLLLIIYRQLRAAVDRVPRWFAAHTPRWLRP